MQKLFVLLATFIFVNHAWAIDDGMEVTKNERIKTIKLFPVGDQTAYAILPLNAEEQLELHFDDINTSSKNYFYTYQLCNADWAPVSLSQFDYIKGFSQVRLSLFRQSSVGITRYFHYSAKLPVRNCMPSRSGNYLLKVFENGDTSRLLFTKKMLVVDNKVGVGANILQPFANGGFRTNQRVAVTLNTNNLDVFNTLQQLRVVVLQNYRWDNAQTAQAPTFIRNKVLEYNQENLFDFEGGKEWRWLDLRSLRLQSDRVKKAIYSDTATDIFVATDTARPSFRYQYYKDFNGSYFVESFEKYDPWTQTDYAKVHFSFVPPNREPFVGKDIYVIGELNRYNYDSKQKMVYNAERQLYEKDLFLKNGYYSYSYATKDFGNNKLPEFKYTEGSTWDTENNYTILIYYKSFGGRADELVHAITVNSLGIKTQFGF